MDKNFQNEINEILFDYNVVLPTNVEQKIYDIISKSFKDGAESMKNNSIDIFNKFFIEIEPLLSAYMDSDELGELYTNTINKLSDSI